MKRKAIELKRGDFFTHAGREYIALQDARATGNPALCEVLSVCPNGQAVGYKSMGPESEVTLDFSRLTPAQTHADELLAQLNELVEFVKIQSTAYHTADYLLASARRGRALVDSIMPPAPVPVEELLATLVDMPNAGETMQPDDAKKVAQILDRAYRSGQLKRQGDSHASDET